MKICKLLCIHVFSLLVMLTAACGGSSNSQTTVAMGGSIQGRALSLTDNVSTVVGSTSLDGTSAEAWFMYPAAITTDGTNLYVADQYGCTIRKIDLSTGTVTTLAGSVGMLGHDDGIGNAARFSYPQGVATDGTNLYVTDLGSAIRKIVIATGEVTTLAGLPGESGTADGIGTAARFGSLAAITTDGTNLYVADTYNSTIRKVVIATGQVSTLAGSKSIGYQAVDGIGAAATFAFPNCITTDGKYLYVGDAGRLRKVEIASGTVTTIAASFSAGSLTTDGAFIYGAGNDYSIKKLEISSGAVTQVAGMPGSAGASDGIGDAARFDLPRGITTDGTNIFVADTKNHTIRKVIISTGAVTTVAGATQPDGTGRAARFTSLGDTTSDGANLYVTDTVDGTVRKIALATGAVTTLAGSPSKSGVDGIGQEAGFFSPQGITTDGKNLYVADASAVRKVVIATGEVTTIAGTLSKFPSTATDGIGPAASFASAKGITTDGKYLFVTDNGAIRKVEIASGSVTTLAGTAGTFGTADGTGSGATFSSRMSGISTDGTNLYIADTNKIRKIVIATGVVTTLAGTDGNGLPTDGVGAAAGFFLATRITTDGINLYVTDWNLVRKVNISTGTVTTIAGFEWIAGATDGVGSIARFNMLSGITTDGTALYVADSGNGLIRKIQ